MCATTVSSPGTASTQPFLYSRSFRTPGANFAPRLGLAWTLSPKTVIRANSGIFYEAPATNLWYNALTNNGSTRRLHRQHRAHRRRSHPAFPNVLTLSGAGITRIPDVTTVTPNFKNAYTINTSFQITQQLTAMMRSRSATSTPVHAIRSIFGTESDQSHQLLADGRPVFRHPRRALPAVQQHHAAGYRRDRVLQRDDHALRAPLRDRLQLNASYTWSHSISDAPDANSFEQNLPIEDATNRSRDRGNSIINRPHAFTASAYIAPHFQIGNTFLRQIANGNELAILANLSSGDAQNLIANQVLNGDSITGSVTRPLYTGRYTLRAPNVYQVDVRYTRTLFAIRERIRPKFIAEANNVGNHPNITSINTTAQVNPAGFITSAPTLAPVSTTLEGRIIQLGLRCDW